MTFDPNTATTDDIRTMHEAYSPGTIAGLVRFLESEDVPFKVQRGCSILNKEVEIVVARLLVREHRLIPVLLNRIEELERQVLDMDSHQM